MHLFGFTEKKCITMHGHMNVKFVNTNTTHQLYTLVSYCLLHVSGGPGSVVGIATGYEVDGPGIDSQWG